MKKFITPVFALLAFLPLFAQEATVLSDEYFSFEITTLASGQTFYIPLSGYIGGSATNKTYNWNIDWGDGEKENRSGVQNANGIPHSYAIAGTYTITITPEGSDEAWLAAFGFNDTNTGANTQTNKIIFRKIISPLTPLMTRTNAQISGEEPAPSYEWSYTFYNCTNLTMGDSFTFSAQWNNITTAGDYFAAGMFKNCYGYYFTMSPVFNLPQRFEIVGVYFACNMFYYCNGAFFAMNSVFNLPQSITTVGDYFAAGMFAECYSDVFSMNSIFNLPQNITTVGDYFAASMFQHCSGSSFAMNSIFNLPQNITTVGDYFAASMFQHCSGSSFTMNSIFNLPQNITTVGNAFAASMFKNCHGIAMNSIFNLPQNITTVGDYFATDMFYWCISMSLSMNSVFNFPQNIITVGEYFAASMFGSCKVVVNDVLKFPVLTQNEINKKGVFNNTFNYSNFSDITYATSDGIYEHKRTALSIINGNPLPNDNKKTFGVGFSDVLDIPKQWSIYWMLSDEATPIISPQIAGDKIKTQINGNNILLSNVPLNSKVEIFNLKGNKIYNVYSAYNQTINVNVKTKGMYIVRILFGKKKQTMRITVK